MLCFEFAPLLLLRELISVLLFNQLSTRSSGGGLLDFFEIERNFAHFEMCSVHEENPNLVLLLHGSCWPIPEEARDQRRLTRGWLTSSLVFHERMAHMQFGLSREVSSQAGQFYGKSSGLVLGWQGRTQTCKPPREAQTAVHMGARVWLEFDLHRSLTIVGLWPMHKFLNNILC